MKCAGITGIGCYLPERIMTNDEISVLVDTSDEWIAERTGIRQRHIAAAEEAASDLGVAAARKALENAGVNAGDIGLIITATSTPDFYVAATACVIQHKIGAANAAAFDMTAACSGFACALSVAEKYVKSGYCKHVLVIASEVFSRIIDWQDRSTCVLFGDGAGAAVVSEVPEGFGLFSEDMGSDGSGAEGLNIPAGGSRLPASAETIEERKHYLKMDGKEIFRFASRIIPQSVGRVMEKAGMTLEDIDLFIPHQANIRIIEMAQKKIRLAEGKTYTNLDRVANTSAASIPIALCECVEKGKLKKSDILVCCAFGAGLTWSTLAMRWAV